LLNQLSSELYREVLTGSTGLSPEVEEAIWNRALSRLQEEDEKAYQEALSFFSTRNWSMPVGMLNGNLLEVRNNIARRNLDLNRDIMVQSSELAQKNRHFVVAQGIALEQVLTTHANNVANRAFEAARFTAQYVLEIYQSKIAAFTARLEKFKALAMVYETRIRAELARVEIYKAQLEGARIEADLQKHLIEIYALRIGAIQAMMEIYRIQMQGAEIRSNIERNKIEVFKAHVDAFIARIGGNTARFQAYQAQVAGEATKVDLYKSQVQAYASQVDAYKAKSDIDLNHNRIYLEANKGQIEEYLGKLEGYKSRIQREIAIVDSKVKKSQMDVSLYSEDIRKYATDKDVAVKSYIAKVQHVSSLIQMAVGKMNAAVSMLTGRFETVNNNIRAGAQVAGQLASAAMNSVSATASVGFSEGRSDTSNISQSKGRSHSTGNSYSRQHSTSSSHSKQCQANPHEYINVNISS
jgi:hypothetical protein